MRVYSALAVAWWGVGVVPLAVSFQASSRRAVRPRRASATRWSSPSPVSEGAAAREEALAAALRGSEVEASTRTAVGALGPALGAAVVFGCAFGPCASALRGLVDAEGLGVLANDEGQYFQNYVNAINVMFSLLLANTFTWLYGQQEQLFVALFGEVSVAKALLEQIAYVSRGRPEYGEELLGHVRRYVKEDLTDLSAEPVAKLLGARGAARGGAAAAETADPLESVMWLTSVGTPGDVYDTVKALREARGQRLGALQRKLPLAHFALLGTLALLVLVIFPLLGAATGAAVAPGDGLLQVQAVLFGLMTFAIVLTLDVLYAFWLPAGSAYNVDNVLAVMIDGLEAEVEDRLAAARRRKGEGRPY